jgi:hypothetical protein
MNQGSRGKFKVGTLTANALQLADTALSFTAGQFNQVMAAFGAVTFNRAPKVAIKTLTGAAIHAGTGGVVAWQNPEAAAITILRVWLDLTTVSTGACTLDVGVTAVSATTTSDTLLDGIDANAAVGVFDSMNAALDTCANALAQKLAAGKWVTIDEKTGDATGLVANLYVEYVVI